MTGSARDKSSRFSPDAQCSIRVNWCIESICREPSTRCCPALIVEVAVVCNRGMTIAPNTHAGCRIPGAQCSIGIHWCILHVRQRAASISPTEHVHVPVIDCRGMIISRRRHTRSCRPASYRPTDRCGSTDGIGIKTNIAFVVTVCEVIRTRNDHARVNRDWIA